MLFLWMQMMRLAEGLKKEFLHGLSFPKRTVNHCQFCTLGLKTRKRIILILIANLRSKSVNLYWQQLFCISQISSRVGKYFSPTQRIMYCLIAQKIAVCPHLVEEMLLYSSIYTLMQLLIEQVPMLDALSSRVICGAPPNSSI